MPTTVVHASEALEMEHKDLEYGLFDYKFFLEFWGLLWLKKVALATIGPIERVEPKLAHKLVMVLSKNIERKDHGAAMDD